MVPPSSTVIEMGTTSAVRMMSPSGTGHTSFGVHYDGDSVGEELSALIARDGYPAVYRVFETAVSRYWRAILPDMGPDLPSYVTDFPETAAICTAVPGYGILHTGPDEMGASAMGPDFDPALTGDVGYEVDAQGSVRWLPR